MTRQHRLKLAAVMLLLPLLALGGIILKNERDIASAKTWRVKITGYHPRDLLYGHYLSFRFDWGISPEQGVCAAGESCCLCLDARRRIDGAPDELQTMRGGEPLRNGAVLAEPRDFPERRAKLREERRRVRSGGRAALFRSGSRSRAAQHAAGQPRLQSLGGFQGRAVGAACFQRSLHRRCRMARLSARASGRGRVGARAIPCRAHMADENHRCAVLRGLSGFQIELGHGADAPRLPRRKLLLRALLDGTRRIIPTWSSSTGIAVRGINVSKP